LKHLSLLLGAFALSSSPGVFAQEKPTASPWSTDFSNYETKVPWVVIPEEIAALITKTPSRNWDEAKVGEAFRIYLLKHPWPSVAVRA